MTLDDNPSRPHVESIIPTALRKFVRERQGKRIIHRVLIANNGLGAVKEIRSVRKWAYATLGDDRAIRFIAMASTEDLAANAEFIRFADEYVAVPGGPNNMNYANVSLIVEVAQRVGAHAVWAGWGHASENPRLPTLLNQAGIAFIGPPAGAMQALGDKISSMIVAQSARVPCLPWSGTGITVEPDEHGQVMEVESSVYAEACVSTVEEGTVKAEHVGYPLMIKASEGGGGKGIRRVDSPAEFAQNFDFVQREVPGSPIFLMQLAQEARHLEVQLMADEYGQAVALYGRDCSVQRRHQKIIEEAPVTIVKNPHDWEEMERAAVRLAKMVGYVNAGTVEFLYDPVNDRFSFLELNPRLQVEHPCTESISEVNVPACQLQVAMGIPLHCIDDVRRLYEGERDETAVDDEAATGGASRGTFNNNNNQHYHVRPIDFDASPRRPPKGHVIACRITAENPDVGFKPGGGRLGELTFRSFPDVWGYFSIATAGSVHEYADSQFGHVFAWGRDRLEAIQRMVMALKEVSIRAEFRTTVEYLVRLLETSVFRESRHTTAWLDGLIQTNKFGEASLPGPMVAIGTAAWKGQTEFTRRCDQVHSALQRGQAPTSEDLDRTLKVHFIYQQVQYEIRVKQTAPDRMLLEMAGTSLLIKTILLTDGGLLLSMNEGQSLLVYGREEAQGLRLTLGDQTVMVEKERDPTVVRSPSPGKLVRYLVKEGMVVPAGTAIAEIEVMKMYMPLVVAEAGSIMPTKAAGAALEAGEVVAKISLLDPASVAQVRSNVEGFATAGKAPVWMGKDLNHQYEELMRILDNSIINGYYLELAIPNDEEQHAIISKFIAILLDAHLPFYLALETLSRAVNRLPGQLVESLTEKLNEGLQSASPSASLLVECTKRLETFKARCDSRDLPIATALLERMKPHARGPLAFAQGLLADLCDRFMNEAVYFDNAPTVDVIIKRLAEAPAKDNASARMYMAWAAGEARQVLLGTLLKNFIPKLAHPQETTIDEQQQTSSPTCPMECELMGSIRRLTKLHDKSFQRINQAAREALMALQLPSIKELQSEMSSQLYGLLAIREPGEREAAIGKLVAGLAYHMDVLPTFFLHEEETVRMLAIEIYVRRVFEAFDFVQSGTQGTTYSWVVSAPPTLTQQSRTSLSLAQFHRRSGIFCVFKDADQLQADFESLISRLAPEAATKNVVYFALPYRGLDDAACIAEWEKFLQAKVSLLAHHDIKRLTIVLVRDDSTSLRCYTFRQSLGWREDCQVRHMEPAMSYLLELPRILHNYTVKLVHADATGQIHIYKGTPVVQEGTRRSNSMMSSRLFVRVLVRPRAVAKGHYNLLHLTQDARAIFVELLDAVAMVQAQQARPFECNHLYINILPTFFSNAKVMADMFLTLMAASEEKLLHVRIMEGEIRMNLAERREEAPERFRFFLWNETGFVNRVAVYKEVRTEESEAPKLVAQKFDKGVTASVGGSQSNSLYHLDGRMANAPHALLSSLQAKRNRAHALETSYVYDFPAIFQKAAELAWSGVGRKVPEKCFTCTELILEKGSRDKLCPIDRPIGQNDIGMVAWQMTLVTPQHPQGRQLIVIANDIDFEIGSFGVMEDHLFAAASRYAREQGWPRIFLSANSGARIGLAEELRAVVKAYWRDETQPHLGFEYLYLEAADYEHLHERVRVELVPERGHYRITDIVSGLGVENLSGSALIAGETSRAYTEAFTLTFVTGRSVGIGAYLVRLGQRVIQKQSQPIILTGVQALNQLLGRNVYASNLQIGGPQIMAANGVSHLVVKTDLEGAQAIVQWLEFVWVRDPRHPLAPIVAPSGPVEDPDRPIAYIPNAESCQDPRLLVTGAETGEGVFLGGLLDRGSFVEYQAAWARSVIVGRGLLGGLPVAVLLVETRTTQTLIPADPASPNSEALTIPQAGQVWYPDSAYKTAQFLRDCSYGERLPLLILANWRGFSGGQRDLFDEILKFGSYIVDALREYQPPVFVYLPPGAQLRGGSWVVVDTAINPRRIEMYADPSARGGILEAEGLVAIKFRGAQLRDLLTRLIPSAVNLSKTEQDKLIPLMHHVACSFADLHDRPGRMLALGVIRGVVPWREARSFFYHRLRVRTWILQLLNRAAHLCGLRTSDTEAMDSLYDDMLRVLEGEWLPAMFIDASSMRDAEVASSLDHHHELLEVKVGEWARRRTADRIAQLLNRSFPTMEAVDKAIIMEKLAASERTRSASPNR